MKTVIKLKNLEKMLPYFVDILNHKGITLEVIKHFVEDEINNSNSLGTLFRGNSIASKLIKEYTPIIAYEWLHKVLDETIIKIVSENKNLEVCQKKKIKFIRK